MYTDPVVSFIIVLIIGIVANFLFDHLTGPNWFTRQVAGPLRRMVTGALVGIAGAFIGFHIFVLLRVAFNGSLGFFIGAMIGAGLVSWLWRQLRE